MKSMNLLNLPQSELKKAQAVVAGGNRPDLVIGGGSPPVSPPPAARMTTDPPEADPSNLEKTPQTAQKPAPRGIPKNPKNKPNYLTLYPLQVRVRNDQVENLSALEFKLGRRGVRSDRLTKASIVRALLDLLPEWDLDLNKIDDEDALRTMIFAKAGIAAGNQALKPSKRR